MTELIQYLESHIIPLGAWGVFWASMIEEVVTPIPSALIMTASGFFLLKGPFSPELLYRLVFIVAIPSMIGVTLGSFLSYAAGFWGGKRVLDRFGVWFGLSWDDVVRFQNKDSVKKAEVWTLFLTRAIPFVPSSVVAFFCGFIRQKISTYILITFAGVFVRSTILALVGWYAGELYGEIAGLGGIVENILLWGVAVILVGFLIYKRYWAKKSGLKTKVPDVTMN